MLFDEKQATSTDVEGEYLVDEILDSNGEITVKKAKNRYGHVALPRSGCWHDEKSMEDEENIIQVDGRFGTLGLAFGVFPLYIRIPKDGWQTRERDSPYKKFVDIDILFFTTGMTPQIVFAPEDEVLTHKAGISPACEIVGQKLRVYAMEEPAQEIGATLILFDEATTPPIYGSGSDALEDKDQNGFPDIIDDGIAEAARIINEVFDEPITQSEYESIRDALADKDQNGFPDITDDTIEEVAKIFNETFGEAPKEESKETGEGNQEVVENGDGTD